MANVVDITRESNRDDIYLALEHVESWTGKYTVGGGVRFDSQAKRFRAEDVLFGKLRPYLAKVTRPNQSGVCVSELLVLRPRVADLSSRYLEQLLRSKQVIDAVDASTFGAKMPRADWQFIGDMRISLPPLAEQRAIARYLDYVDGRIERYIRAKERLIGLLEEQKRAVINQAVTRGLDPDVPLKPSGVEWLGDVPAHWEVVSVKRVARSVQTGTTPSTNVPEYFYEGTIPWHGPSSFGIDLRVRPASRTISHKAIHDRAARVFNAGSVMIVSIGATIGKVGMIVEPSCCNQQITAITFGDAVVPAFGAYQFKRLEPMIKGIAPSTTLPILNQSQIAYLPLVVAPRDEQIAINAEIERVSGKIDSAVNGATRQIELMKEYRTRLISDVVTGKLDVREAAANLPEELGEDELLGGASAVDYPGTEA